MKILVTGANGYLAKGVIKKLIKEGNEVIATDLKFDTNGDYKQIIANIFELEDPYIFFEKPDALLHLAWRDGFKHNSVNHIKDIWPHYFFIDKMILSGIKKVAILGSMHEIGFFEGSISEETIPKPQSLYGIAKNSLREMIELLSIEKSFYFYWIRCFYIVGNFSYGSSIFSKIYNANKQGQNKFPFTNGENQYDFLDYQTCCEYIVDIISQNEIQGIINCCSGKPEKLKDKVEEFIKEQGLNIRLEYGVYPERIYDSKAVWGNNDKLKKIINAKEKKN